MSEAKLSLSIVVPGATLLSSQDCEKMSKKEAYDHQVIVVESKMSKGKKLVTEKKVLHINTRKAKPARQCILISKEAYYHMIDGNEAPDVKVKKVWGNLTIKERLEYNLSQVAKSLGGTSFSYEVLDD